MNASAKPRVDIRGKRLGQGLTMLQLAAKCREEAGVRVSASELSRIERHIHAPRPALRKALADLLGLSTEDFPIIGSGETTKPAPRETAAKKTAAKKTGPDKRVTGDGGRGAGA